MSLKFLFFVACLSFYTVSFAQDAQDTASSSEQSVTPFKTCKSTCKKKKSDAKASTVYSNREWRKIKKEMKANRKKRMAASKNQYTVPKRVLDTIVLEAPMFNEQTQLSSW